MRWALAIIAVGACGGSSHHDSGADAPVSDSLAPGDSVRVTVVDPQVALPRPLAGQPVYFIDHDGTQVVMTDTSGVAVARVGANASATSVITSGGSQSASTVLGIVNGDEIAIDAPGVDTTALGTMNIAFTAQAGATMYFAHTPCGTVNGTISPIAVTMLTSCSAAPMEIVVEATGGAMSYYAETSGVTYSFGGTVTMPAFAPEPTFTATVTDVVVVDESLGLSRLSGNAFSSDIPTEIDGTGSVTFAGPLGLAAQFQLTYADDTTGGGMVIEPIDPTVTTWSIDLAATILPMLGTPSLGADGVTISVPVTTTGTAGDAADIAVGSLVFVSNGETVPWTIYGPDPTALVLPTLPADAGINGLHLRQLGINTYERDQLAGYDAARQNPAQFASPPTYVTPIAVRERVSQSTGVISAAR